jgi:quercetin dioxygenase-like cupin family protein
MSNDGPGELDGVVASPDQHRVLLENEAVRVIETRIVAGETTPIHTHLWPQVQVVLSGSQFVRRDGDGGTMFDTRAKPGFVLPQVAFAVPLDRHSIENTGADDLVVISVELKPAAPG